MNESEEEPQESKLSLNEIFVVLFKQKRKILWCLAAGLAAIAAVWFIAPPPYESQAKLLVRYVLDRSAVDVLESQVKASGSPSFNDNLIASEMEILTSWDLAEQVADAVTVERLMPGYTGENGREKAAQGILLGLKVTAARGSNVILVSYRNRDPELAARVLQELVNRYFVKHLEIHRSAGAFEYVSRETGEVRNRLSRIDGDLKRLKARAGIISLAEGTAALQAEMAKGQEAFQLAEAEEAEQRAKVGVLEGWLKVSGTNPAEAAWSRADRNVEEQYRGLVGQWIRLQEAKTGLLSRYTPESRAVKINGAQIENLEKQKRDLENKFPGLASTAPLAASGQSTQPDLPFEKARLAAVQAKAEVLNSHLLGFKEKVALLSEIGPQIAQLERNKEVEEANYKYFQESLEKARIDEALDPTKMPNISVVQKPSPALRTLSELKKTAIKLAGGGLLLGLALAFLTELGLDRSVRHPLELESMRIPRMLSIPDATRNGYRLLNERNGNGETSIVQARPSHGKMPPWEEGHFIRPFCESLRDRLILYFQIRSMTHKPKLVAVTGCSEGAGTSTLAGGLAAALSETGDGKVLLVDMNTGHEAIHPFFEGRHATSLTEAIQAESGLSATAGNLYLARAESEGPDSLQLIPRKFYDLVPRLKASDFDYIIFDMPPLDRSSTTLAMAGSMDKVLLIVEAEKSSREAVRSNYAELAAVKANVSAIFNKSRSYGPKWLQDAV